MHDEDAINKGQIDPTDKFRRFRSYVQQFRSQIHPGHLLLLISVPLLVTAYRGYRKPLDQVFQEVLQRQKRLRPSQVDTSQHAKEADAEDISQIIGTVTAARAFIIATQASLGTFGLIGAATFYMTGTSSPRDLFMWAKQNAGRVRRRVDVWAGKDSLEIYDSNHPDYVATQGMTEEEELEYLATTYFSSDVIAEDDDDETVALSARGEQE